MAFNGQTFLGYQLPKLLDTNMARGMPLTSKQLDQWFSGLPLLNVQQLLSQIPKYIYKINRLPISDSQRFSILERLRPIVDYLYNSIIKQIRGRNLYLSKEYREFEYLTRELVMGMALGYQRLLFNKAKNKPFFFSRGTYRLLAQRTMYYLGEQIRVSYLLSIAVPKNVWKDFNVSYAFTVYFRLNKATLVDQFAYYHNNKGSIDSLYHRILLLTMISPYSLRNGELDHVYFGLASCLNNIKLTKKIEEQGYGHILDLESDMGPLYVEQNTLQQTALRVDNRTLLDKLTLWLESGTPPISVTEHRISTKLLKHLISNLDVAKRGERQRLDSDGGQLEVITGLQDIHVFLQNIRSLVSDNRATPIAEISEGKPAEAFHNIWGRRLESSWDSHQFYESSTASRHKMQNRSEARAAPSVRRHDFTVENESETSVCISCNSLHGNGLFIGELMLIRGYNFETWTLGTVLWMNLSGKQLKVGLQLLSAKVDWVTVDKVGTNDDVLIDALWLAGNEQGDTLLLAYAEFQTGDAIQLNHHSNSSIVTLGEIVWHSEGFAQFRFVVESSEKII